MEEKFYAWIARDRVCNRLMLHLAKPKKVFGDIWSSCRDDDRIWLREEMYPQIKWEDEEPTKVEFTFKICE